MIMSLLNKKIGNELQINMPCIKQSKCPSDASREAKDDENQMVKTWIGNVSIGDCELNELPPPTTPVQQPSQRAISHETAISVSHEYNMK